MQYIRQTFSIFTVLLIIFKNENLIEHLHDGRAGNYEAILVSDMMKSLQ